MEWDPRNGCPEPILVRKIEKCDEEDLGEMFSRTSSQFAGKFVEFAVLVRGDSFRKYESFIKGAEYQKILEEKTLNPITALAQKNNKKTHTQLEALKLVQMSNDDDEVEVEEEPNGILEVEPEGESEVESPESIKAPSLSSMVIKEVMEWDLGSNPEPHLMDKIMRCEEEDMYEMYSQNIPEFETKFQELAILVKGDFLKKTYSFY